MVGKHPSPFFMLIVATTHEISTDGLGARVAALPGFAAARAAAERAGVQAYLVGGAVRDTLLGLPALQLDLVVEGDQGLLVEALGGPAQIYDRFETATVRTASGEVDVARARAESYPRPGALPEVRPATIAEDLDRRDFTVNALAVPLADPDLLVDPHRGVDDLGAGVLRILHDRSFVDDPTRALRAARYAARLGLEPEPRTMALLRETDLNTVSRDRVVGELAKLAEEDDPRAGLRAARRVGPGAPRPGRGRADRGGRGVAVAPAVAGDRAPAAGRDRGDRWRRRPRRRIGRRRRPARRRPRWRSPRGAQRGGAGPVARAAGAAWLDDYVERWRDVRLAITGEDLIAAGVPEGPRVGRGLDAALRAKLDGETAGRDDELRIALEAAGLLMPLPGHGMARARWRALARGRAARRPGGVLDPRSAGPAPAPFESLNLGLYTDDAEDAVRDQPRPPGGRARARRGRRAVRLPGPRRRRSNAASAPPSPNPFSEPDGARPAERDGQVTSNPALTPLVQVADCLPVALPASAAWRCCTAAGAGSRRASSPAGPRRSARPPRRSVPGSAPAATRSARRCWRRSRTSATGSPTGACSTCPRSRGGCSTAPGSTAVESSGLCTSCEPELFFSHRRDAGRTGRQAGLAWIDALSRSATSTPRRCAATSSGCASAAGRRSRSWPRPSTSSPEELERLAEAGVELVGENRLQDLEAKRELYGDRFAWDFIGNLQSRKVKRILPLVRLIHSVATDSVLEQLGRHGTPGHGDPRRGQRRRRGGRRAGSRPAALGEFIDRARRSGSAG